MNASGKNRLDHFAVVEFEAFAAWEFEFAGVQAQATQDCCVDIGHVMTVLDGVETQFVRHAMLDAPSNAGAGEPRAKGLRMMIAPGAFGPGRTTEFGPENHQGLLEHAALFEILEQTGDGPVHLRREFAVVRFDFRMRVPLTTATAAVKQLHEAHAALDQPSRHEALFAEGFALRPVQTV